MVLLAALASSDAARRSQGYTRQLWTLLAIALFLETLAQAITTYYQRFVPGSSYMPIPSDILFFVWAAPVFMMFLPAADEKSRGWDWLRILDFAQIAIVAITAYLYFFYSPSKWLASASDLPRQILILISCVTQFSPPASSFAPATPLPRAFARFPSAFSSC